MKRVSIAGALILWSILLAGCQAPDNRARLVIDNQSPCGTITITLTNTVNGQEQKADAPTGQKTEIEVKPDVYYSYVVDFTSAGRTQNGFRCTKVESGKLAIPAGASQTFVLRAETPIPVQ